MLHLLTSLPVRRNKPLQLWEKHEETPARSIARVLDDDIQSSVIELSAHGNIAKTWIRCPMAASDSGDNRDSASGNANDSDERQRSLHIRLPHLVLLVKPLSEEDRELSVEVHVRDSRKQTRRFRASTFQKETRVHPLMTLLPLRLDAACWNQLQFDLARLTRDAYGTTLEHTISVQLHANCRVRRVYFAERMVAEEQLPTEFRLYKRLSKAQVVAYKELDKSQEAAAKS